MTLDRHDRLARDYPGDPLAAAVSGLLGEAARDGRAVPSNRHPGW